MIVALVASVVGFAGCFPDPLDESGKRCDAEHGCSAGWTCFDFVCQRPDQLDAGPDQLLVNGGFEESLSDGGLKGWRVTSGWAFYDKVNFHSGARALRLVADGGSEVLSLQPTASPVVAELTDQIFCARVFLRSSDGGIHTQLNIREHSSDGGFAGISPTTSDHTVFISNGWTQVSEDYTSVGPVEDGVRIDLVVRTTEKAALKTDFLLVDDVQLKRSVTRPCVW